VIKRKIKQINCAIMIRLKNYVRVCDKMENNFQVRSFGIKIPIG